MKMAEKTIFDEQSSSLRKRLKLGIKSAWSENLKILAKIPGNQPQNPSF